MQSGLQCAQKLATPHSIKRRSKGPQRFALGVCNPHFRGGRDGIVDVETASLGIAPSAADAGRVQAPVLTEVLGCSTSSDGKWLPNSFREADG
jgi:hypothetical protein